MPGLADLAGRIGEVGAFLGSSGRLLRRIVGDRRVPRSAKLVTLGAAGYALSPLDVIPDGVPVVGHLDDVWLLTRSLRHLVQRAGHDVVREHWDGTEEGFQALLFLSGISR